MTSGDERVVQHPRRASVVTDLSPQGSVSLREPVRVRFDRPVDRGSVERAFRVNPPTAGDFEWVTNRAFAWYPKRWRAGTLHTVRVSGQAADGAPILDTVWRFRSRVPAPRSIPPGDGARVVLTFDDAPRDREQALRLLDDLRFMRVRAVLFPVNQWARHQPEWVERARRDGHLVCNHTFSHRDLTRLSDRLVRREIESGAGHGTCRLLRPPFGAVDARVRAIAEELGYQIYLWDVDSQDWEGIGTDDIAHGVLRRVDGDSVVLFHMNVDATFDALPLIVRTLRRAGYVLSHLPAGAGRESD